MGTVIVDSSVLLGVLDAKDAHHVAATQALRECRIRGDRVVVPIIAFTEILVGASRLGEVAVRTTESFVDTVADEVSVVDREVGRRAAALRARHRSLRLPDALVLATAQTEVADRILTADHAWARYDARVELIG
jgi:predicted nucleic acid-binding protein